jgi:hypothetical protein
MIYHAPAKIDLGLSLQTFYGETRANDTEAQAAIRFGVTISKDSKMHINPDVQMIVYTPVSGTGTASQMSSSLRSSLGKVTSLDASFEKVHHIISGTL